VVYKKSKGKEVPENHDVEIFNFELLSRGATFPYLKKLVKTEGTKKIETYEMTPALEKLISNQNTFLIIDEAHSLKNTSSSRSQAVITFINECTSLAEKYNTNFKVLMCSGTLFDKPEHTKTFLKMMKILKSRNLFYTDPMTLTVKLEGLQEVIDAAKAINPRKTQEVLLIHPFDTSQKTKSADVICYELFVQVILEDHSSSMGTQKTNYNAKQELVNIYLNLSDENYDQYSSGISMLSESVAKMARAKMAGLNKANGDGETWGGMWGGVMKSLQILEFSKCTSLALYCYEKLVENPNLKIVIGCWFINSIEYLAKALNDFGALTLTGASRETERADIVDLFQNDDDECRVIIGQMSIISQSISLDDTTGVYRREAYFIPNYQAVPLQQAAGRIHRKNTRSDSTVYYVYGKQFSTNRDAPINAIGTEFQLLTRLVEKGETLKSINKTQVETGKKFLDENENLMDIITVDKYNSLIKKYKIENLDIEEALKPRDEDAEKAGIVDGDGDGSKSSRTFGRLPESKSSRGKSTRNVKSERAGVKSERKVSEPKSSRLNSSAKKTKKSNSDIEDELSLDMSSLSLRAESEDEGVSARGAGAPVPKVKSVRKTSEPKSERKVSKTSEPKSERKPKVKSIRQASAAARYHSPDSDESDSGKSERKSERKVVKKKAVSAARRSDETDSDSSR
jgi:hypothetical protein